MKTINIIVAILTVAFLSTFITGCKSSKTVVKENAETTTQEAKALSKDLNEAIKNDAKTNYALVQAKVALLKTQVALEVDKSEQKAKEELDNAIAYLSEAKNTADEKTKAEIDLLKTKVNTAKKSVEQKKDTALEKVSTAALEAKTMSEEYNKKFQTEKQKNIATINRKYTELRAEEALLKAKIAAQSEKTYAQAQNYLKEANEWYIRSKEYGTQKINPYIEQIQKDIADAQAYLEKKDKEARNKITNILEKVSNEIKKE